MQAQHQQMQQMQMQQMQRDAAEAVMGGVVSGNGHHLQDPNLPPSSAWPAWPPSPLKSLALGGVPLQVRSYLLASTSK